ncbi:MAG: M1 family metallopeptidase [Gemmatimonadota bacterium]|nr:M1 family metallopeptidase [Gemmatimonadota bacterium]
MIVPLLAALAAAGLATAAPAQDAPRFRQGVEYRIEARLDESTDMLTGLARLRYTNRSPVVLDTLYFHQHLNAFRPNSAWATRELRFGNRRFQDQNARDHAYERFTSVTVDGTAVRPVYPGAPDSSVVAIPLPRPLASGGTAELRMGWDARLSTIPRRQGREGRSYDWAQWYPRIAVFESGGWQTQPLLPQGEFYGEFATYDVTLDVRDDQVIGSTGVPVEGDPGWRLNGAPLDPTALRRDAYAPTAAESLGLIGEAQDAGRKRVRWRAEDVHHFAWSASPTFRYDGVQRFALDDAGVRSELPAIHVLYQPTDTLRWEGEVARRTYEAVRWTQQIFGPYLWPQLTVLRRVEARGGTEFPMLIMNSSNSEGLIVHEVVHEWVHGMLANNEWREGWLDEGFASFLTNWYFEEKGQGDVWVASLDAVARMERNGQTQPIGMPGADFRDPATYSAMTYTKTSLVFRMLREYLGEEVFRRVLRAYFDRHKLGHVSEDDFRRVAEEVSGRELGWFFQQWLHSTDTLDYGIGAATTRRLPGGRWATTVQVIRLGEAWMPVQLVVGGVSRTLDSRERTQTVQVETSGRPSEVVLDPQRILLDVDPTNNRSEVR